MFWYACSKQKYFFAFCQINKPEKIDKNLLLYQLHKAIIFPSIIL